MMSCSHLSALCFWHTKTGQPVHSHWSVWPKQCFLNLEHHWRSEQNSKCFWKILGVKKMGCFGSSSGHDDVIRKEVYFGSQAVAAVKCLKIYLRFYWVVWFWDLAWGILQTFAIVLYTFCTVVSGTKKVGYCKVTSQAWDKGVCFHCDLINSNQWNAFMSRDIRKRQ